MFLIILIPFLGALLWAVVAVALPGRQARSLALRIGVSLPVLLSFFVALSFFVQMLQLPAVERTMHEQYYTWIALDRVSVQIGLVLDPLSMMLVLLVTGVGSLIHIYSVGYMAEEKGFARFFAWLNLFTALMLVLVMADSALLMFIGWEGVGLCSYGLIGFWYSDTKNAQAGMKAFLVNRVGDTAFLIALFLLFWKGSDPSVPFSFTFASLSEVVIRLSGESLFGFSFVEIIAVLFVLGATGKSAQIPLFVWLPDAMAGPTPVSALIHAATMVTAGIYMIARMSALYLHAPFAMAFIVTVGVATSLMAAFIALSQYDIKKVLAYSTISQLGYMFAGVGSGAFTGGVFHLLTHGFFKALLFLAAGSVILGVHHEQDMRKMGGLWKSMRITAVQYLVGVLAISGFFPFSGFFSKDEILLQLYELSHDSLFYGVLFGMGALTALLTSFYMFRSFFMVFLGEEKTHAHETGPLIWMPLIVLAVLSTLGGLLNVPPALTSVGTTMLQEWLAPVFNQHMHHPDLAAEWTIMLMGTALAFVGMLLAYLLIYRRPEAGLAILRRVSWLHQLSLNKFYVDEIYAAAFLRPTLALSDLVNRFDRKVIDRTVDGVGFGIVRLSLFVRVIDGDVVDRAVNLTAQWSRRAGAVLRRMQDGYISHYLGYSLMGVGILIVFIFVYRG